MNYLPLLVQFRRVTMNIEHLALSSKSVTEFAVLATLAFIVEANDIACYSVKGLS